ncbi:MAG: RlmE family RNA methyltransferase [Deltaproteobacteria bacterium]|jgi:23S rRNA (uridine2552-2'-O)-methyltransferase|nr:RlmE family RNA methyltransferase [Deltaproteobacteria bacterium]
MAIKDRSRLNDHYSQKARSQGYPARSVYKLSEFDAKRRLFKPGQKVLDLGCAPGSWTLYVAEKVGPKGLVVGLDLNLPPGSFPSWVSLLAGDIFEDGLKEKVGEFFANGAHAVISDLAPKTTGARAVDQARSLELVEAASSWAGDLLKPDGFFLFKVFQSQMADDFIAKIKEGYKTLSRLKPQASRSQSQEIFVLLSGFKGRV